jgi:hypothetical protein
VFGYRITKYNPQDRNELGHYQKKDWIGIDDIGKTFDKKKLTLQKYLQVEAAYAQTIIYIMDYLNLESLTLKNFTKLKLTHPELLNQEMLNVYNNTINDEQIDKIKAFLLTKLLLREEIAGIFENKEMFVHFGYDYYMYIGSSKELPQDLRNKIENLGLFVEDFESPYLPDND